MIFWCVFAAAVLHVIEEYFFPGGFVRTLKDFQPRLASFVTTPFAVIINGLFLAMCLAGAIAHGRPPLFGLTVAALVGLNGLMHVGAAARLRGYAPGVVTGVALYLPLAVLVFVRFAAREELTLRLGLEAAGLALLLQAVPIAYLILAKYFSDRGS